MLGSFLGFHWELMSYIGNVHPNVGKYHGKILGLVGDFFCPQNTDFMLRIQHLSNRKRFPCLHSLI